MRLSGFELFPSTATRERLGTTSLSSSRRFSSSSTLSAMKPVMFASGRARLETRPVLMTSPMPPSTIGIVVVARLAAKAAGVPQVTIKSTGQRKQFCGKAGVAFLTALRETIFDDQVLTLDVAKFSQPFAKALDWPQPQIAHQPDALHPHRPLSARCDRPGCHRAAEQLNELATSHWIASSAIASSPGGTASPSAFTALMLITDRESVV